MRVTVNTAYHYEITKFSPSVKNYNRETLHFNFAQQYKYWDTFPKIRLWGMM